MMFKKVNFILLLFFSTNTFALSSNDVMIIINDNSTQSISIGNYYKNIRSIPEENICKVNCSNKEVISVNEYFKTIKPQILDCLNNGNLKEKIKVLVTTTGFPLKYGVESIDNAIAHILSEPDNTPFYTLNSGYYKALNNPYYGSTVSYDNFKNSDLNDNIIRPQAIQDCYVANTYLILTGKNFMIERRNKSDNLPIFIWPHNLPDGSEFYDIDRINDTTYCVVGNYYCIGISTNNGNSWATIEKPVESYSSFRSVMFISEKVGWVAGDKGYYGFTTDGGKSWMGCWR